MARRWGWAAGLLALAVALAFLAAWLVGPDGDWSPGRIDESIHRGNRLIAAIRAHREASGRYPATLGDLVPAHLDSISPPTAGTGIWDYGATAEDFFLAFHRKDFYQSCSFDFGTAQWHLDG